MCGQSAKIFSDVTKPTLLPPAGEPVTPPGMTTGDQTQTPDLETTLSWPDVGETRETPKPMRFWVRRLA